MPVTIRDEGRYELYETDHGHRILVLGGERSYAWIEGQESPILVHSDSDHTKARTLQRGRFVLVDFEDDPKFKDMPHLFLEDGHRYQEYLLPNGLPTERDAQKRFVVTDETLGREDLDRYLEQPAPAGPGESRMDRPGGGSMANVAHYLRGVDLPKRGDELESYARERGAPDEVLAQLRRIGDARPGSMAEVMEAIGGERGERGERAGERRDERGGERELPIPDYDELPVREAAKRLDGLGEDELRRLREHEREHKDRKTMLEALDRRL